MMHKFPSVQPWGMKIEPSYSTMWNNICVSTGCLDESNTKLRNQNGIKMIALYVLVKVMFMERIIYTFDVVFFPFCKFRKTTSTIVLMETLIADRILYNIWVVSVYINRMCIQSNPKLVSSF